MSALALIGWLGCALSLGLALTGRRRLTAGALARRRACHELRGALTAAGLGLELEARAGRLAPHRRRALELELGRAAAALEDLLRSPARVARREVDVAELLTDSIEASLAAAQQCGVELRLCWSGPRAVVQGDRRRLARVTSNLIANAIEHGAGPVRVTGRADSEKVRVEVTDRGPGLSAPVAELVARGRRRVGERGHGLAIACAVAAAHGGRLAAAPSDSGARLVLELPVARPVVQSSVH